MATTPDQTSGFDHSLTGATGAPGDALLQRNLALIARRNPIAAKAIAEAGPAEHIRFGADAKGGLSASYVIDGVERLACSARDAAREGEVWADAIDVTANATIVVQGFGCGHHVRALASRMRHLGGVIVFEPDTAFLRETLRRVDLATCFGAAHAVVMTGADDTAAMAQGVTGIEGLLAAGIHIADHPPSRHRLGKQSDVFASTLAHVVKAVRTNVVTTLVQSEVTARNCIQNLGRYSTVAGVKELAGCFRGRSAVVVSAGPSLRRNIDALAEPGVRDRVVIIAVQTTLKTLLAKGIKPHFVVALDYHEISRRFYEGLTESDVKGVTLVVDPKCNPTIMESFPGEIRCAGDDVADRVAGEALWRDMGRIQPGSTVAHLAYYLARHLGCDPVMMIGQDLGFTDHQYYAPGAAIHDTWASELNDFNTLEMLEWQRIVRMRQLLRVASDQEGRRMYTDEQMATYLVQFERDFAKDEAAGLTVIDATEGGVAKAHTVRMTLRDALARCAVTPLPALPASGSAINVRQRREGAKARLRSLDTGARNIVRLGRECEKLLARMLERHEDQREVNRLIAKVQEMGEEAAADPAHWLVQFINQTGQLKRFRADRSLELNASLTPLERQRGQITRDLENVRWLADAAEYLATLTTSGLETLAGKAPVTRDPSVSEEETVRVTREQRSIIATIPLLAPSSHVERTIARVSKAGGLGGVALLVPEGSPAAAQARSLANASRSISVHESSGGQLLERAARVRHGRAWARHAWRGGIANLTIHDEVYHPAAINAALKTLKADAAALAGHDWCLVDPALLDAVIDRYLERPDGYGITFTQAAPGLSSCVIAQRVAEEAANVMGCHASIGGLLGYIPVAPQADPISKPVCPAIAPSIRDCPLRCTFDVPEALELFRSLPADVDAARVAAHVASAFDAAAWPVEQLELHVDASVTAQRLCDAILETKSPSLALTLRGPWAEVQRLAPAAHACGVGSLHVRTSLEGGDEETQALLESCVDVISLDLIADSPETFRAVSGRSDFEATRHAAERLVNAARAEEASGAGLPGRWIVPRITRTEATLDELETFYDRWLLFAGACVIDAPSPSQATARIAALPIPPFAKRRSAKFREVRDLRAVASVHPSECVS